VSNCDFSNESIMTSIERELSRLSFVIVTHVAFTGHAQELEGFLRQHNSKLLFIGHPFYYANQKQSTATFYTRNVLTAQKKFFDLKGPEVLVYMKDFLATFYFFLKFKTKFQIYIGIDPLNAFVGLLLKRLGFAKRIIFYTLDYVPLRFGNPILNSIYQSVDKLCVRQVDCTWNLSSEMANARENRGIQRNKTNQMTVPTGTRVQKYLPFEKINRYDIAFLSHLRQGQGIELILDAMPEIIKSFPSARLLVIGTGPLEEYFKEEVKKRGIADNVVFYGYIKDHRRIEELISSCGLGLAPYVPDPQSFTWYADPGKPKVYLGCGVPVIITKVPAVAREINQSGAGIAIHYNKSELVNSVSLLFGDEEKHRQFRKDAINFASNHTWDNTFFNAFEMALFQLSSGEEIKNNN
jgi:glycosyltransferase involved in cell wall biosynthesis